MPDILTSLAALLIIAGVLCIIDTALQWRVRNDLSDYDFNDPPRLRAVLVGFLVFCLTTLALLLSGFTAWAMMLSAFTIFSTAVCALLLTKHWRGIQRKVKDRVNSMTVENARSAELMEFNESLEKMADDLTLALDSFASPAHAKGLELALHYRRIGLIERIEQFFRLLRCHTNTAVFNFDQQACLFALLSLCLDPEDDLAD
jgi:hypothetical protein